MYKNPATFNMDKSTKNSITTTSTSTSNLDPTTSTSDTSTFSNTVDNYTEYAPENATDDWGEKLDPSEYNLPSDFESNIKDGYTLTKYLKDNLKESTNLFSISYKDKYITNIVDQFDDLEGEALRHLLFRSQQLYAGSVSSSFKSLVGAVNSASVKTFKAFDDGKIVNIEYYGRAIDHHMICYYLWNACQTRYIQIGNQFVTNRTGGLEFFIYTTNTSAFFSKVTRPDVADTVMGLQLPYKQKTTATYFSYDVCDKANDIKTLPVSEIWKIISPCNLILDTIENKFCFYKEVKLCSKESELCLVSSSTVSGRCFHAACVDKVVKDPPKDSRAFRYKESGKNTDEIRKEIKEETNMSALDKIVSFFSKAGDKVSSTFNSVLDTVSSPFEGAYESIRAKVVDDFGKDFLKSWGPQIAEMVIDIVTMFCMYWINRDLPDPFKFLWIMLPSCFLRWGLHGMQMSVIRREWEKKNIEKTHTLQSPLIFMGLMAALVITKVTGLVGDFSIVNISRVLAIVSGAAFVSTCIGSLVEYFGGNFFPEFVTEWFAETLPVCTASGLYYASQCDRFRQMTVLDQLKKTNQTEFVKNFENLSKCANSTSLVNTPFHNVLSNHVARLYSTYSYCKNTTDPAKNARPTYIYVEGKAGIGKSHLTKLVRRMFVENWYPDISPSSSFYERGETDHFDGYHGQVVVHYNDKGLAQESITAYAQELMNLHDGEMQILPMASNDNPVVGQKGTFFTSPLVLISSNKKPPEVARDARIDYAAFIRRLDITIRATGSEANPEDTYYTIGKYIKDKSNTHVFTATHTPMRAAGVLDVLLELIAADRKKARQDLDLVHSTPIPMASSRNIEITHGLDRVWLRSLFVSSRFCNFRKSTLNKCHSSPKDFEWADVDEDCIEAVFARWRETEKVPPLCPYRLAPKVLEPEADPFGYDDEDTDEHLMRPSRITFENRGRKLNFAFAQPVVPLDCATKFKLSELWEDLKKDRFKDLNCSLEVLLALSAFSCPTLCSDEKCKTCGEHLKKTPWYKTVRGLAIAAGVIGSACLLAYGAFKISEIFNESDDITHAGATQYNVTGGNAPRKQYDTKVNEGKTVGEATHALANNIAEDIVMSMSGILVLKVGNSEKRLRIVLPGGNYGIGPSHYYDDVFKALSDLGMAEYNCSLIRKNNTLPVVIDLRSFIFLNEGDLCSFRFKAFAATHRTTAFHSLAQSGNMLAANRVEGTLLGLGMNRDTNGLDRRVDTTFTPLTNETYERLKEESEDYAKIKWRVQGWQMAKTLFPGDCGLIAFSGTVTQNCGFVMGIYVGVIATAGRIQKIGREELRELCPGLIKLEESQCMDLIKYDEFGGPSFAPVPDANVGIVGRMAPKCTVHSPLLSAIEKSPLHPEKTPYAFWTDIKEPVILSNKDTRWPMILDKTNPLRKATKYGPVGRGFSPVIMRKSLDLLAKHFFSLPAPFYAYVYPIHEALNGVQGREFCKAIDVYTSPGAPYIFYRKEPGRKDFVEIIDLEKVLKNGMAIGLLRELEEYFGNDDYYPVYWCDCIKDETLKPEKVYGNVPREFNVGPLHFMLLCKMYFGCFVEWFYENRIKGWWAPGMNIRSHELSTLIRKWQEKSGDGKVNDFDYVKWDKSVPVELLNGIGDLVSDWYEVYGSCTARDRNIRKWCMITIMNRLHIVGDLLYEINIGNSSGNWLTVVVNSIMNTRLVLNFICEHYAKQGILQNLTYEEVDANHYHCTYGDDLGLSVSASWSEWFIGASFKEYCESYGLNVTAGNKSLDIIPITMTEMSFLKCKFKEISPGLWIPLLEIRSINSCLSWMRKGRLEIPQIEVIASEINSALEWLFFYGSDMYFRYLRAIFNTVGAEIRCKIRSVEDIVDSLTFEPREKRKILSALGFKGVRVL